MKALEHPRFRWRRTWLQRVAILAACFLALNVARAAGSRVADQPSASSTGRVAEETSGKSPEASKPAQTAIEKVLVTKSDQQTEVRVEGTERLSYVTFHLSNPDRLVLDFSGALVRVEHKSIPSDRQPVREVRIGQFKADVARVVIDLERQAPYFIREDGNVITVVLGSVRETAAALTPKKEAPSATNAVLAKFSGGFLREGLPRESSLRLSAQSAASQDPPAATQVRRSPSVAGEPPAGSVPTPQTEVPAHGSEETSASAQAGPKTKSEEPARQPLSPGAPQTPLPDSSHKPPAVLGTEGVKQPETSASDLEQKRPSRTQPSQTETSEPAMPEKREGEEGERKDKTDSIWTPPSEDYVIGVDDLLAVNVWREPEISRVVSVRPDGKISLPLIGQLKANGLTPRLLEAAIVKQLAQFVFEPDVTIIVQEIRSQKFNIVGEVSRPGAYQLTKPMTVFDAIALAGGFRDFAKVTKIYVLRLRADGSRERIPFNYNTAIQGGRVAGILELETHDTVVVP